MKITIIGTGYVGLVTGACLAETGNQITCLDIDKKRIKNLLKNKVPFFEPGLKDLIKNNLKEKRISFTDSYKEACKNNIFFLCIGTPKGKDGNADLTALNSVLALLSKNLKANSYIFTKSTVPIGTNDFINNYLNENVKKGIEIKVSSNPEFLKEGSAVNDFMKPDRIIVGTEDKESKKIMKKIYTPFNRRSDRLIFTSTESAELIKYAANSFLALKISFMNEMALICEKTDANIHEIRKGIGSDPRIGSAFLYAGLGYGGSCFPKDVDALMQTQKKLGLNNKLLRQAQDINEKQIKLFTKKIIQGIKVKNKKEIVLTVWGLSFKPNTDDIRESMSLKLIKNLSPLVKRINLYDPLANENARRELRGLTNLKFFTNKYRALSNADSLIVATEWKEFWDPDLNKLKKLKSKVVFDGRNILNQDALIDSGLKYIGIGI